MAKGFAALGWMALLVAIYFVDDARPVGFAMDRGFFGVSRRASWDADAAATARWWLLAALICSALAFGASLVRPPRTPSGPTLLLCVCATLGFVLHLLKFG